MVPGERRKIIGRHLVPAIPGAFEGEEAFVEGGEHRDVGAGAAAQLAVIVAVRFLARDPEQFTLAEVGRDLNLSKERVRQIQKVALDKLRRVLLGRDELADERATIR